MAGRTVSRWALGAVLLVLVGCASVQPRIGIRDGATPDGGMLGPRPAAGGTAGRPAIEQVCRAQARPSGYIAIAYTIEGERCPRNTDPDNPYNGAVVERHADRPVGSIMTICADQSVPAGWTREHRRRTSTGCAGARVREGAATAMAIRRAR